MKEKKYFRKLKVFIFGSLSIGVPRDGGVKIWPPACLSCDPEFPSPPFPRDGESRQLEICVTGSCLRVSDLHIPVTGKRTF